MDFSIYNCICIYLCYNKHIHYLLLSSNTNKWSDYMENILNIHISETEPGMVVAEDIYNNFGAILIHNNTLLDLYTINKLKYLNIDFLKVYKDYTSKDTNESDILAKYDENLTDFKDMVKDIGKGKNLDTVRIQNIVGELKDNFTSINDIISSMNRIRSIDDYTYSHSLNVSLLSSLIARWLEMGELQCKLLSYCGLLHDIGKSKISPEILNKPGALTSKEFEEIKKHPVIGYKILENNIAIHKDVAYGVLMHHEREDGSGYPFGVKSPQITLYAKIVAIADMFDAMTSDRVYKKRQTPFDVFQIYESEYLTKLDTYILLTFLKRIASFYIGSKVRLSNDLCGEIIFINDKVISKPMIRMEDSSIIDLSKESGIFIEELI